MDIYSSAIGQSQWNAHLYLIRHQCATVMAKMALHDMLIYPNQEKTFFVDEG